MGIGGVGLAAAALLDFPCGLVLDSEGNLYIMDQQNFSIRMVAAYDQSKWDIEMTGGHIYSVAGNVDVTKPIQEGAIATQVDLDYTSALALNEAGDIFIANYKNMVYAVSMLRTAFVEVTASQQTAQIGEPITISFKISDGIGKPLINRRVTLTADNGTSIITPMTSRTDAEGTIVITVTGSQLFEIINEFNLKIILVHVVKHRVLQMSEKELISDKLIQMPIR